MSDPIEVRAAEIIKDKIAGLDLAQYDIAGNVQTFRRTIGPEDPNFSVGVILSNWQPSELLIGQFDPVMGRYLISIQTMVKQSNREQGEREHAILAKLIRVMLYRDEALRVSLLQLRDGDFSPYERAMRYGVIQTNYADTKASAFYAFLSMTDIFLETEIA
jgi:hypothetical protein